MFSSNVQGWMSRGFCCALLLGFTQAAWSSDTIQLSVVPNKCISLQKDQTCYQRVTFRWKKQGSAINSALICLWREDVGKALRCWSDVENGDFRYALEASTTTRFFLVAGELREPEIASTTVSINWVYNNRSSRRSRWRLF